MSILAFFLPTALTAAVYLLGRSQAAPAAHSTPEQPCFC